MELNFLDRVLLAVAPRAALDRIRSRTAALALARHYEAATAGRRTGYWNKGAGDANATLGPALATVRALARDMVRNNTWGERALEAIVDDTVGWGIVPKASGASARVGEIWRAWAESTECDADGRLNFYGLQALVLRTMAETGEALVRRRWRRLSDGLPLPMTLQVLEPDFLDATKDGMVGQQGGKIVKGVEFDAIGRRVAYWLYQEHPGSSLLSGFGASKRVPADDILHVYRLDRPGQVRGISWFVTALMKLNDFDDYEDAALWRQKIAACFAAFVTDPQGANAALAPEDTTNSTATTRVEKLEPGMIKYLGPGQTVEFGTPPAVVDGEWSRRTLHRIAAGLDVEYERMTGDYSQVNYSSARMARIAAWPRVEARRWRTLVPLFCAPAWSWAMQAAVVAGLIESAPPAATWTAPPMAMIEPDKEGLALQRLVRIGAKTPSEMVREQGGDPEEHWAAYAADLKRIREHGIQLDCDVSAVTQAGQVQADPSAKIAKAPSETAEDEPEKPAAEQ